MREKEKVTTPFGVKVAFAWVIAVFLFGAFALPWQAVAAIFVALVTVFAVLYLIIYAAGD